MKIASVEDVHRLVAGVEGWLSRSEGACLYRLARSCRGRGAIVEIGSWQGKSAIYLAHGSRAGSGQRVHAIDPHTGSPEHRESYGEVWTLPRLEENVKDAGVADLVVPVVATAASAAADFDQPIELLFIDGAHEYDDVRRDFDLWEPKVVDGGVVALHDVGVPDSGPRRVVAESLIGSGRFRSVWFAGSIVYGRKALRRSRAARVRGRLVLAWKLLGERVAFKARRR